jgi:hypothetical protein
VWSHLVVVPERSYRFPDMRVLLAALVLLGSSCASVHFEPDGPDSGHFRSSAVAVTFLGNDMPQAALLIARANAADSELPNLIVERESVFPYLWKLDFLLELFSIRYAVIEGTWGPPAGE